LQRLDPSSGEERTPQRTEDKKKPRFETEAGDGRDGESGTDMKSETGERIEKGRAERMAGTIDGDLVTSDSVSFYSEVLVLKYFV
jgi:hypothetical protein